MTADDSADSRRVWVVDDDRSVRFVLATALRDAGYEVDGFENAASALAALRVRGAPDLLFTDVRMPGDDGLVLLDRLKSAHPQLPVIVMSAYTDVASTASAFRGGAHEFLSKPFDLDDAVALAARALPAEAVAAAAAEPTQAVEAAGAPELIGDTPAMRALFRAIGRLAQAPLSVLITGETGTGKELVAHALHRESPRSAVPFVALNTAAIPAELLESELFGHEAGAFTGAGKRHIGRFEQANGGTLFLDEIGDMPAALQTRLLRVLAEGEFFRVGGRELIRVDVRVWPRPTSRWRHWSSRAASAPTCCIGWTWFACACRRCAIAARTSRNWPRASWPAPRAGCRCWRRPCPRPRSNACARITGRATCVSWRTSAGGWQRWRRATWSPPPTWLTSCRMRRPPPMPMLPGCSRSMAGSASSCRPACKTCMRRQGSRSTAPSCRPRWRIAVAIAARPRPRSGWAATP